MVGVGRVEGGGGGMENIGEERLVYVIDALSYWGVGGSYSGEEG